MSSARVALPRLLRARGRSRSRRRAVVRLAAAALLIALLAAGWLWLRDSSLVAVRHVRVDGLTGRDARVREALKGAARSMTTLHVREGELRDAVAAFPVVKDLRVQTDFPHGLRIRVIENVSVAEVEAGGRRVAAAANGALLVDERVSGDLPLVAVDALPTSGRVRDSRALGALAVAGAAPASLRPLVERIRRGHDGLLAELRGGLRVVFGSRAQLAAKWAATARVIADPASAGATYIDVRVPERPVAGGLGAGQGSQAAAPPPQPAASAGATSAGTAQPANPPAANETAAQSAVPDASSGTGGGP